MRLAPDGWSLPRLQLAAGAASLYWVTQLSAGARPGTAFVDPPRRTAPQAVVSGVALALVTAADLLEHHRPRTGGVAG